MNELFTRFERWLNRSPRWLTSLAIAVVMTAASVIFFGSIWASVQLMLWLNSLFGLVPLLFAAAWGIAYATIEDTR